MCQKQVHQLCELSRQGADAHETLKRRDVFSFLLDAKDRETQQGLGMVEIGAPNTTMIVAGMRTPLYELPKVLLISSSIVSNTSSTAIAATFIYLCRYLAVYEKVAQEVRSVIPSHDDVHLGPDLPFCVFLRASIDESLPIYLPAGSALWREVGCSGVSIDGHPIAPGCDVGTEYMLSITTRHTAQSLCLLT